MQPLVSASATPAGALISSSVFKIPPYQREYAWTADEIDEFWFDILNSLEGDSYFLGLVILTESEGFKEVVDGQQRLITLTLLAAALRQQAIKWGRKALARRIEADFLRFIDYETDEERPRLSLSDVDDNEIFQKAISGDVEGLSQFAKKGTASENSSQIIEAYLTLDARLKSRLSEDPFKELGRWAEFIREKLYFAVFVHPDPASAYRVFEVINTRGRGLTTADLLKNYILSQSKGKKDDRYQQWQKIAKRFPGGGSNLFVQYIRHVVTVRAGHILPKDLYDYLANRVGKVDIDPPSAPELMSMLEENLAIYLQMVDPTLEGPASEKALEAFSALNELGVVSVRPLMLAIHNIPDSTQAYDFVLRLVVRRMVVGNLGTGNVERRLSDAARRIASERNWTTAAKDLADLIPSKSDFQEKLARRSLSKGMLAFMRRSILQKTRTPAQDGTLHYIVPPHLSSWEQLSEEDISYWGRTIGNTILCDLPRRPHGIDGWQSLRAELLPKAIESERVSRLERYDDWSVDALVKEAEALAKDALDIWF